MPVERFSVLNRFSGTVQFAAEIECKPDAPAPIKLGLAIKWGVKSHANMAGAYMAGADMAGADMAGAYMGRANMAGANMAGAYMAGAYMAGAKIKLIIARATRTDGPEFIAFDSDRGPIIRAGCRTMTPADYRAHVAAAYPGTPKARETLRIIDYIDACAKPTS